MRRLALSVGCLVVAGLMVVGSSALGATINYGDFDDFGNGGTVEYVDVTESSADAPLYGAPMISVNTLDFDPTGFAVSSEYVLGGESVDGQLNFGILPSIGYAVEKVMFSEGGDFVVDGIDTTADWTRAVVSAPVRIDIWEVDGVPVPGGPIQFSTNVVFSPEIDGVFDLATWADPSLQFWDGELNFDVNLALTASNVVYELGATKVEVVLDNRLSVRSDVTSEAAIAKKDFMVSITAIVPEPSVFALSLLGLAGLILSRRRMK